jgi:hypothetical protein
MKWNVVRLIMGGMLAVQACSAIGLTPTAQQTGGETAVVSETPFVAGTVIGNETTVAGATPVIEGTAVAGPTGETPAAAAVGEVPVSFENISFVIPSGLATGATPEGMPAVGEGGAPWEIAPAHVKITLTGYPLQGTFFEPHILVIPAAEYEASSHPSAAQTIERIRVLLSESAVPTNDQVPGVPMFNATKVFGSQIARVNMQNGGGVRLVTTYAQGVNPISNYDLMYQFQGLTSDGSYYVIANLPINASFLAAQQDPGAALPEGGIPFPDLNTANADQINAYVQAVADRLNATSPDSFQPTLAQLDSLIQSIQISP